MENAVALVCKNYFEGFQDISTFSDNDSCKNILGILKIVSYFTLVTPLFFGVVYCISSLIGRVTPAEKLNSEEQRTSSIGQKTLSQSIEEQLENFFKSSSKAQKLFTIDGSKVGVIYNPGGGSFKVGMITAMDPVALVSEEDISAEILGQIAAKIPSGCNCSIFTFENINGQPTFAALGFE